MMNGIDKITERITMDAQADANAILARAQEDASAVLANYQKMAEDEKNRLLEEGRKKMAEREIRMVSVAELEGRKQLLSVKQQLISEAFAKALDSLLHLPTEEYVSLLTNLVANAAAGNEELLFSEKDREAYGEQVTAAANQKLGKNGKLTLAAETRPIQGGVILKQGDIEVNCSLETQVRMMKEELALEIAAVLFEE
jgi:V/A-type H+-transporting ATPase subunit E